MSVSARLTHTVAISEPHPDSYLDPDTEWGQWKRPRIFSIPGGCWHNGIYTPLQFLPLPTRRCLRNCDGQK